MPLSSPPAITHSKATLPGGRRFHVVKAGDGGPKLFLLPGCGGSWRSFEAVIARLAGDFLIIAADQRGHGATDPADSYAMADYVADGVALVGKSPEPLHLVGHALGALVAERVARQVPAAILSLTLIGGALTARGNPVLRQFADRAAAAPAARAFVGEFCARAVVHPDAANLQAHVADGLMLAMPAWAQTLRGMVDDPQPAGAATGHGALPTLIVRGAQDAIFSAADHAALLRRHPHAAQACYPDLGHAPHWEDPGRVSRDLARFIHSVASRAAAGALQQQGRQSG